MTTALLPGDIRTRAFSNIERTLGWTPNHLTQMASLGDTVLADALIALETEFGIDLDPSDVLPDGTVSTTLWLVELRVSKAPQRATIFHWDDERARRALPLHAPRVEVAVAAPEPEPEPLAAVAPDVMPLPTPPTPAGFAASPPPEAWTLAAKLYARERRDRMLIDGGIVVALAGMLIAGTCWLRASGLL